MTLDPSLSTLILDEQAREDGRLVEGIDLDAYLDKLASRAEILADTLAGRCRGFVAFYANNLTTRQAFITLVLVAPEARGVGLGGTLVKAVLSVCRGRGFETCQLEVRRDNAAALAMYRGLGFRPVDDRGEKRVLEITL